MKKAITWLMLLTVSALFAMSITPALAHTESDPFWAPLYAGSPHYYGEIGDSKYTDGNKADSWWMAHKTPAGSVFVWNTGENLYVRYYTPEGMSETHLAVVTDPDDFPMTKSGNPKVGKFPYKHEGLSCAIRDNYMIPLDWDVGTVLFIAAHAALCNGETAWGDCGGPDAYFAGGNWATYFNYTVQ